MLVLNLEHSNFYKLQTDKNIRMFPSDLTGSLDDFFLVICLNFLGGFYNE